MDLFFSLRVLSISMTLYKVRIMKKVAIVTPEALKPRSFIWDEVTKHFRAKISSFSGNKVTQEEDGLCVIGSGEDAVESYNNPFRRRFVDNTVDLPLFKMSLGVGEDLNLYIDFKDFDGTIGQFSVVANTSDGPSTHMFDVEANSFRKIEIGMNVRISYIHANRIMVMEVFKAFDNDQGTGEGFVDVLIDADINDFNNLPDFLRTDVVIPS